MGSTFFSSGWIYKGGSTRSNREPDVLLSKLEVTGRSYDGDSFFTLVLPESELPFVPRPLLPLPLLDLLPPLELDYALSLKS